MSFIILQGDALHIPLADESVQCVVTSPPYWGLRDYGTATWEGGDTECDHRAPSRFDYALNAGLGPTGSQRQDSNAGSGSIQQYRDVCAKCGAHRIDKQLGLERVHDCLGWATGDPCGECYVCHMVAVFREVWRVLRKDGVVWLNLGDTFVGGGRGGNGPKRSEHWQPDYSHPEWAKMALKPKNLAGIPWRVAMALQADGWWLRSDVIWAKPNCFPESVKDRPTKSHEYVFLLAKSGRYFYDADAVQERALRPGDVQRFGGAKALANEIAPSDPRYRGGSGQWGKIVETGTSRNLRSVWSIATCPFPASHFAVFPPAIAETCIKAGTSEYGCCPICGAPWRRVVEKGFTAHDGETDSAYAEGTTANRLAMLRQAARERGEEYVNGAHTVGWEPTCKCPPHEPVPCVVFDPFSGAGTTVLVADRLGRHGIGLELNAEYCEMARQRILEDAPLLAAAGGPSC